MKKLFSSYLLCSFRSNFTIMQKRMVWDVNKPGEAHPDSTEKPLVSGGAEYQKLANEISALMVSGKDAEALKKAYSTAEALKTRIEASKDITEEDRAALRKKNDEALSLLKVSLDSIVDAGKKQIEEENSKNQERIGDWIRRNGVDVAGNAAIVAQEAVAKSLLDDANPEVQARGRKLMGAIEEVKSQNKKMTEALAAAGKAVQDMEIDGGVFEHLFGDSKITSIADFGNREYSTNAIQVMETLIGAYMAGGQPELDRMKNSMVTVAKANHIDDDFDAGEDMAQSLTNYGVDGKVWDNVNKNYPKVAQRDRVVSAIFLRDAKIALNDKEYQEYEAYVNAALEKANSSGGDYICKTLLPPLKFKEKEALKGKDVKAVVAEKVAAAGGVGELHKPGVKEKVVAGIKADLEAKKIHADDTAINGMIDGYISEYNESRDKINVAANTVLNKYKTEEGKKDLIKKAREAKSQAGGKTTIDGEVKSVVAREIGESLDGQKWQQGTYTLEGGIVLIVESNGDIIINSNNWKDAPKVPEAAASTGGGFKKGKKKGPEVKGGKAKVEMGGNSAVDRATADKVQRTVDVAGGKFQSEGQLANALGRSRLTTAEMKALENHPATVVVDGGASYSVTSKDGKLVVTKGNTPDAKSS